MKVRRLIVLLVIAAVTTLSMTSTSLAARSIRALIPQATTTTQPIKSLSDAVAGCDGLNRIVYAIPGHFGAFDVWGFTFQLAHSSTDQLNDLISLESGKKLTADGVKQLVERATQIKSDVSC